MGEPSNGADVVSEVRKVQALGMRGRAAKIISL